LLRSMDVLIIAKPETLFSEQDKYKIDQFILRGGKTLFLLDRLRVSMDSVSRDDYFALPYALGLDDQLFRYGVRINPDLVQDRFALRYPVITGVVNGKPQMTPIEWPFMPLISQYADHPITRNLDVTVMKFASSIDTVKANGIRKTPLLFSSAYARKTAAPVKVTVNDLRRDKPGDFTESSVPMGYLLTGRFTSLFKNRFLPEGVDSTGFLRDGIDSKIIVVGDGDLARNEVSGRTGQPQELGLDGYSGYTFANKDLLMNMVSFLANESGLINARSKEIKLRPLDKERIRNEKVQWQLINVVLPVLLVMLAGATKVYLRRKKYASYQSSVK
jgi:ABC-2 type transport system permease protein